MASNSKPLVIGVGELLWDLLPGGKQPGGAPANFAFHARELGSEALVVSRVGNDPLGREMLDHLAAQGLRTDGISIDPKVPTGIATVKLDPHGKPSYTIAKPSAWDFIEADERTLREAARADAICFGTLAQRNPAARRAIQAVLRAAPPDALRIFDVNLREHFWSQELIVESLKLASVFKLNDEELPLVASALNIVGDEIHQLREIVDRYGLRAIALTKGAAGSVLLGDDTFTTFGGSNRTVVDTVGAGDAFTAALAVGLIHGWELAEIQRIATEVAGYVCSGPGATPGLPPRLRTAFAFSPHQAPDPVAKS
jgi:fructokinase